MDKQTKIILTIILYGSMIFSTMLMLILNQKNLPYIFIVALLIILTVVTRHNIKKIRTSMKLQTLLLVSSILLCFVLIFLDNSFFCSLFPLIIIGDVIYTFQTKYSMIFTGIVYISTCFIVTLDNSTFKVFNLNSILISIFEITVTYIGICSIIYILKKQLNQHKILLQITNELEIRTSQLEKANLHLQQTSRIIEDVAILRERNTIAREIHDTVGHTLTTVLVELEAGKRLIDKDPPLALEKISLAQEQVRKGLNNIRNSVKTLKQGNEILDLLSSFKSLINETQKHTGIVVNTRLPESIPDIPNDIRKVLFRALQEGLTNGIRHGNATCFDFDFNVENSNILFSLANNGKMCNTVVLGFGLSSMKENVESVNGTFNVNCNDDEGFCIKIVVPISEAESSVDTNTLK